MGARVALAAAEAVQGIDLDPELIPVQLLAFGRNRLKGVRGAFFLFFGQQHRPDGGVRADHGALVALDAVFGNPFRYIDGNPPFFIPGGTDREDPVR